MNAWCEQLGISVPSLAAVRGHREANTYALVIVALLERGAAMTLPEIAEQFVVANIAPDVEAALAPIKRCRPARAPIYKDGDLYSLDPYDADLDLWAFRLGLRPPKVQPKPPEPAPPRPPTTERLTVAELERAWRDASLQQWSLQRIALAVIDAHDRPMTGDEVAAFVAAQTKDHRFVVANTITFRRKNSAVAVAEDGSWSIVEGARELAMARDAVRDLIGSRASGPQRSTPEEWEANTRAWKKRQDAHAAELAAMRRAIVVPFPASKPRIVVLLDVAERQLSTHAELDQLPTTLSQYDILCGDNIRSTLRALGMDPTARRLADLGPPQKTYEGKPLTTAMLVRSTCHLPLLDEAKLAKLSPAKLVVALEENAKALLALHEYGKLHARIRLDVNRTEYVMLPAPWHHHDEPTLYALMQEAVKLAMGIIAVVGPAPAFEAPWARAEPLLVLPVSPYQSALIDETGIQVDEHDVQLARLETTIN